jgi:hypothetical protein
MAPPRLPIERATRLERGTSLLEIVITMAIVTIGLLGFFTLHIRSSQTSSSAAIMIQASAVAAALQDQLQAIPLTPSAVTVDPTMNACTTSTAKKDPLADLCFPGALTGAANAVPQPINVFGTRDATQAPLIFYPSWDVEWVQGPSAPETVPRQVRITVRVRYPSEEGRCPSCGLYQAGWKAITTSTYRTYAAY